jgi:hypothetical protein
MRLVRLTRPQRVRLRLQVQLRLPRTNKQPQPLPPPSPQHLHPQLHPVRARNQGRARMQVQARNRVPVRNRVQARSRLQVPTPPRHRPVNKMNFETMTFVTGGRANLVGRGSRLTENCFRSWRRFSTAGSIGPMNLPSRWCTLGTAARQVNRPYQSFSRHKPAGPRISIGDSGTSPYQIC